MRTRENEGESGREGEEESNATIRSTTILKSGKDFN